MVVTCAIVTPKVFRASGHGCNVHSKQSQLAVVNRQDRPESSGPDPPQHD
jgi:hypothetical protein